MSDFISNQIHKDEVQRILHEEDCPKYVVDIQELEQAAAVIEKATSVSFDINLLLSHMFEKTLKEGAKVSFTGLEFFECLDEWGDEAFVENDDIRKARAVFTQVMRNLYVSLEALAAIHGVPLESMDFVGKLTNLSAILVCRLEDHIHA